MKKKKIYASFVMMLLMPFQQDFYTIQFISVQNNTVSMATYVEKKVIITIIDAQNPDITHLKFLDSLQNSDTSLRVIAVPALDFGKSENNVDYAKLVNELSLDFVVAKAVHTRKNAGPKQHSLFKWLTDVNENSHFNYDVETIGQLFIVSKNGVLYSVLGAGVTKDVLKQVLDQNLIQ